MKIDLSERKNNIAEKSTKIKTRHFSGSREVELADLMLLLNLVKETLRTKYR